MSPLNIVKSVSTDYIFGAVESSKEDFTFLSGDMLSPVGNRLELRVYGVRAGESVGLGADETLSTARTSSEGRAAERAPRCL